MLRQQLLLCLILFGLNQATALAQVLVTNHKDGSTVRYPVILVRGTLPAAQKDVTVKLGERQFVVERNQDQFKALVELKEGANSIQLHAENPPVDYKLHITWKPQTNPYYVRLVWMTDSSGATEYATPSESDIQDYESRLRTAATLMQTFTAEKMHDIGMPRRTFRLERDDNGKIIVHTLKGPKAADYYYGISDRQWWQETFTWLNKEHPDRFAKNTVLAAYTRKDQRTGKMQAHTALGGGNLGLFGSASVFSWPANLEQVTPTFKNSDHFDAKQVHNDSAGRNTIWGLASTTIGATLHEMGHTFDLPHCNDGLGIMTRGFDRFNRVFVFGDSISDHNRKPRGADKSPEAHFSPISASYLQLSPWFQLDKVEHKDTSRPKIKVDKTTNEVTVTCESGVAWVGFWVDSNIYAYRAFEEVDRKSEVRFSKEQIETLLNGKKLSTVTSISTNGKSARANAR